MKSNIVVGSTGKELKTDVLLHPGKVLKMELKARGLTKSEFASNMSDILKGKQNISEEIALKIEGFLDISAGFWMRLQVDYNISMIKAMNKKVKNNPLRFKYTAQEIRDLNRNREVDMSLKKGTITLKPINKIPSLSELLCKVTKDNTHDETDTGNVVGKEDNALIAFSKVPEANEILSKSEKTAFVNSLKSTREKKMKAKPNVSKKTFWNVDFDKIDFLKSSSDVISRIVMHGSIEDFNEIVLFYGENEVESVISADLVEIEQRQKKFGIPKMDNFTKTEIKRLKNRLEKCQERSEKQRD